MRSFLSNDPDFQYCLAQGCSSGHIHDTSTEGYIFRCTSCGFRMCVSCKVPFHTDKTCAQYQAWRREEEERKRRDDQKREEQDQASKAEIERSTTKCPGCKAPIHKYVACDHITCKLPTVVLENLTGMELITNRQSMSVPILLCVQRTISR